MNRDTSGVNLHIAGVSEVSTLAVARHGSGTVTTHCVGREEVSVAITTRSDDHSIGRETLQLTSHEVLGDDTTSLAVDDDHIEHFIAGVEFHLAGIHLCREC